jgi:hypothetical protein
MIHCVGGYRAHRIAWVMAIMTPLVAQVEGACEIDPERPDSIRLNDCRPAPITPEEKQFLLASLPATGEVTKFRTSQRIKLKTVLQVLRFHERDNVYELKVVSVPQASAGLYGRGVLLLSLPALRILTSHQLAAIAAHEIGHEYVWEAVNEARAQRNHVRLRQLELACDAIAAITLREIGVAPEHLASATEQMWSYNHRRFGIAVDQNSYPTLKQRRDMAIHAGQPARSNLSQPE